MMLKFNLCLVLIIINCILGMANAANLSANIDKPSVQLGETFTLTLTLTDTTVTNTPPPDFTAIKSHFNILATYFQTSIVRSDQNIESKYVWRLTLEPISAGDVIIPKLSVANLQTKPIKITVSIPTKTTAKTTDLNPLFLEASVNTQTPPVKSEIIYTLKMFYSKPIQNLILEHPKILDSIVYPLAGQKTYRSIIQQQPYHVIEQRYAIFPLKMGTLTIKGPHLTGEVKKTASVSTQDSTSWDEVNIHANDITLEVKPEVGPAKSWLPAQKLTLSHHWSTPISQLRVGQPVTLIITLEAIGLPGTELPDLNQWRIPNILHQNTLIRTTYNTDHIVGKRIYTITLLPQKPGQLIIPAYELTWWNTQTKQQEIAKISAQTWQVLAPLSPPQTSSGTTNQAANIGWYENPWSWVSLTLAIVNLGSIAYYRRRIQRLACKDTTSSQTSLEN